MPDDQNSIRRLLHSVGEACKIQGAVLLDSVLPTEEALVDLRQGLEISIEKLTTVRDWVDERLR